MTTSRIFCVKYLAFCLLDKIPVKYWIPLVPNTCCLTELSLLVVFVGSEIPGMKDRFNPLMHIIWLVRSFRESNADKWQQSKMKSLCKHATQHLCYEVCKCMLVIALTLIRDERDNANIDLCPQISILTREKKASFTFGTSKLIPYFSPHLSARFLWQNL